jgi:hypothetical protein
LRHRTKNRQQGRLDMQYFNWLEALFYYRLPPE